MVSVISKNSEFQIKMPTRQVFCAQQEPWINRTSEPKITDALVLILKRNLFVSYQLALRNCINGILLPKFPIYGCFITANYARMLVQFCNCLINVLSLIGLSRVFAFFEITANLGTRGRRSVYQLRQAEHGVYVRHEVSNHPEIAVQFNRTTRQMARVQENRKYEMQFCHYCEGQKHISCLRRSCNKRNITCVKSQWCHSSIRKDLIQNLCFRV